MFKVPVILTTKEHSGAYSMGVEYAYTIVHGQPTSTLAVHH